MSRQVRPWSENGDDAAPAGAVPCASSSRLDVLFTFRVSRTVLRERVSNEEGLRSDRVGRIGEPRTRRGVKLGRLVVVGRRSTSIHSFIHQFFLFDFRYAAVRGATVETDGIDSLYRIQVSDAAF
ncbi:hypothetical protein QE152_g21650 [Popillia japonica]|uniref:Uncharacterized protein n=1 Tax=Popillia japonica TaxID=7064 RepID=A0AAW1KNC9_POPJA